ncbi:glycoside hydrolase family 31 protein [Telmatobacter sp. DSM 110680]|uniref:Glycoside hydrolase family 31 protein n=1 Tax=Telmatobacter sp. DSM 110680 TaxID=3036704 RepID=A0AAU7DI08_9BACT
MKAYSCVVLLLAGVLAVPVLCQTKISGRLEIGHKGATIVFEPYAPNIVRVTLSLEPENARSKPGYGFVGFPDATGWSSSQTDLNDIYQSSRIIATVERDHPPAHPPLSTELDIAKFFNGSTPGAHITFTTPDGKKLLEMTGWQQAVPNHKDGTADINNDRRPTDPEFFTVGATFVSPDDEHYYGLGDNHEGFLDHRGHPVRCWNDYLSPAAPTTCVPFLITNKGYGLIWDNPSKTTIEPGFNEQTKWTSQVGDRVSFFVIAGNTADEIYAGYRLLTGPTPLLPKAAYGYIQCKQRYTSQDEVLSVAKGYRDRHLPADVMVVDWFYYTKMGQMDMDPKFWPDPAAMNKQLHDMGFETMISVWPRFVPNDRYYSELAKNGWLIHTADGKPINGLPYDRAGSDIDTTNPDAAGWYWTTIRDNILSKGFDSIWADETEPDLPPNGAYYHIGPGTQFYNVYPLLHTGALSDGFRRDLPQKRALILSRDAYLGVQRNGAIVWSSDIYPTWDTYRRQIPTGLDFTASGITYWSNDTGGWQYLPPVHHPAHPPLLDPSDARDNVGGYDDYPELYTRWFQYATFLPIMRAHGSRRTNEVWSYGKQAEPILEKYLRLRYELMPYIYSLGYQTWLTGAPFMRALPLDFPNDPNVADLRDEYMFGPAFLVAPVTEQGATSRKVYLPAGSFWYNYWTNERVSGGQTITVSAPIDTIPLFVRAGSIVPIGSPVASTHEKQTIAQVRIYVGADSDFTLFSDDGTTYAYEKGAGSVTHLHWNYSSQQLTHDGPAAWNGPDSAILKVIGPFVEVVPH